MKKKSIHFYISLFIFLLFFSLKLYAKEEDGFANGSFLKNLIYYSEKGNPQAQYVLGGIYSGEEIIDPKYKNLNIKPDMSKAIYWSKKSANQGYKDAKIALVYLYGKTNKTDSQFYWTLDLAKSGDDYYQNMVGNSYHYGVGVPIDLEKAFYWYSKAANNKNYSAQNSIGYMYEKGIFVQKDLEKSFNWYYSSASHGNSYAQNNIAGMYEHGYFVEKNIDKAFYWYTQSANQGNNYAQVNLGNIYLYGEKNIKKDEEKAFYLYIKSSEFENEVAYFNLGFMYENGIFVNKDINKSIYYYKKSADKKYKPAIEKIKDLK